jgi:hypothetical protein
MDPAVMSAGYFSSLGRKDGPLTTSGGRTILSYSKVRFLPSFLALTDIFIFTDVIGRLEGEAIVGQSIPPLPLFWSRMEHPEFELEAVGEIDDWRAPILDLWNSPHTRIHIRPRPPSAH